MEGLGIDYKLLIAQIINFLVLFFLLKRFLYKPIIDFLDHRRKKIEEGLANAQKIEERLVKIEEEQKKILRKAEEEGTKIIQEKRALGEKEKERIIAEAREKAREEAEKELSSVKIEIEKAREELIKETREMAIDIAERLLRERLTDERKHKLVKRALS